jgi:hypothetical protein
LRSCRLGPGPLRRGLRHRRSNDGPSCGRTSTRPAVGPLRSTHTRPRRQMAHSESRGTGRPDRPLPGAGAGARDPQPPRDWKSAVTQLMRTTKPREDWPRPDAEHRNSSCLYRCAAPGNARLRSNTGSNKPRHLPLATMTARPERIRPVALCGAPAEPLEPKVPPSHRGRRMGTRRRVGF